MKATRHGRTRAQQRGFPYDLLDLIAQHGRWDGDRQVLDCSAIDEAIALLDAQRRRLIRLRDKGGGTIALGEEGALITVFSPRTFQRRPVQAGRDCFVSA